MSGFPRFLWNRTADFFQFVFGAPPEPLSEKARREALASVLAVRRIVDKHTVPEACPPGRASTHHVSVPYADLIRILNHNDNAYWSLK